MERLSNIKTSRLLLIACFMAYMVTTTVKMCVPTVISAMVSESFLSKTQSGILTGSFYLVYGIGQLVFGKFFNTHSGYIGVKIALWGSAACCILMSFTDNFYLMLIIWLLCAAVNSTFFPAVMEIISFKLYYTHSLWANKYFLIAFQSGSILCLFVGSFIIKYFGFNKIYYFGCALALLCFIFWLIAEYAARKSGEGEKAVESIAKNETKPKISFKQYNGSGIYLVFVIAFCITLINGIKNWAPTIIMETYGTSPSFSVLLNVVLIATNITFLLILGKFSPRNKLKSLFVLMCVILPVTVLVNFESILNEYIYLILLGIITSATTYGTSVTAVQIPSYFGKYNDVARISGMANMFQAFAYLVSNFVFGTLADNYGWRVITVLCTVFVVINVVLTAIAAPKFKRFINS